MLISPLPNRVSTELISAALERSIPLQQQLRRQLVIDLLLDTSAPVNDIVAVVNWIMQQPAEPQVDYLHYVDYLVYKFLLTM